MPNMPSLPRWSVGTSANALLQTPVVPRACLRSLHATGVASLGLQRRRPILLFIEARAQIHGGHPVFMLDVPVDLLLRFNTQFIQHH